MRHVDNQAGQICLWIEVDPEAPKVSQWFHIFGTGHTLQPDMEYLGSVLVGGFVWHIFAEEGSELTNG